MKNILVLGSGRSGTSMVTGALETSGYHIGNMSNYLGTNRANPKGYFEDLEINTINEDILSKSTIELPEKIRKNFFPAFTFYRARWLARIPPVVPIRSNVSIDERIEKVLSKTPFCYKDPRFSYTLPIWQKHLKANTIFLVVYREPLKTADSILRECRENPALKGLKMNLNIALNIWRYMYNHILKNYRQSVNKHHWIFVHYEQLFDPTRVREIEEVLGVKLNLDFPDRNISRANTIERSLSANIENMYTRLNNLSSFK